MGWLDSHLVQVFGPECPHNRVRASEESSEARNFSLRNNDRLDEAVLVVCSVFPFFRLAVTRKVQITYV